MDRIKRKGIIIFTILLLLSIAAQAAIIDDLKGSALACMPMETDCSDLIGNITEYHEISSPAFQAGKIGNAITLTPADYCNFTIDGLAEKVGSVVYWTKPTAATHPEQFVSFADRTTGGQDVLYWQFRTGSDYYSVFWLENDLKTALWYGSFILNEWRMYSFNLNGSTAANSGMRQYVNKTLEFSNNDATIMDAGFDYMGVGVNILSGAIGIDGQIDELMLFDRAITKAEIDYIFDNEVNCTDLAPAAPPVTSAIDLIFLNKTGSKKATFDEGEDFYVWANYTYSNNSAIIDGECNFTIFGGLVEQDATNDLFSVCGVGCDYNIYTEQLNLESVDTATNDTIHFNACHPALEQGVLIVNLSCQTGYDQINIDPSNIPTCSAGYARLSLESHSCITRQLVNVSFIYEGINNRRKNISQLAVDREFLIHKALWDQEVIYNTTLKVYVVNRTHEYYEHGSQYIAANCTSSHPLNQTETITIVNVLPQIIVSGVEINNTIYDLDSSTDFKFFSDWNFLVSVNDDDLTTINITLYNSSGIVASVVNTTSFILSLPSSHFRDFGANPFNLSIWANDTTEQSFVNISFNVSDITAPYCSPFLNLTIPNASSYTFDNTCWDDSFFSFMINCSDGFGFLETNLFTSKYIFNQTNTFFGNTDCNVEVWDAHTLEVLSSVVIPSVIDDKDIKVETTKTPVYFKPITARDDVTATAFRDTDRIRFNMNFGGIDSKSPTLKVFHFTSSPQTYYNPDDTKYKGWLVDFGNKIWFDSNIRNDPKADVFVSRLNSTTWRIDVYSVKQNLEFESIGQLNNATYFFNVSVTLPFGESFDVQNCPDSVPHAFIIFIVVVVAIFLLIAGFIWDSIFGALGALAFFPLGFVYFGCSSLIGLLFIGIALVGLVYMVFARQ